MVETGETAYIYIMKENLTSIKVTPTAKKNFNLAAAHAEKKQWEISEEASKDILKKISTKIKSRKQ